MSATRLANRVLTVLAFLVCAVFLTADALAVSIYEHTYNRIDYDLIFPRGEDDFSYSYIEFKGLKDENVQRAINKRIEKLYYNIESAPLPAYRGMKILTRTSKGAFEVTGIDVFARYGADNLITVIGSRNIEIPYNGESKYVNDVQVVTFDLATGREVELSDMFKPGADYMGYVNRVISEYLLRTGAGDDIVAEQDWEYDGDIIVYQPNFFQVAPFTGIKENPKFAISLYEPYLSLSVIIDDQTPEFDTNYGWCEIEIPLCDEMDFNEKFRSEDDIYSSPNKELWFTAETING